MPDHTGGLGSEFRRRPRYFAGAGDDQVLIVPRVGDDGRTGAIARQILEQPTDIVETGLVRLCHIAEIRREAVRSGTLTLARKNAPFAPRVAIRAGLRRCAAVTLQARFTGSESRPLTRAFRELLPAFSSRSDKVELVDCISKK